MVREMRAERGLPGAEQAACRKNPQYWDNVGNTLSGMRAALLAVAVISVLTLAPSPVDAGRHTILELTTYCGPSALIMEFVRFCRERFKPGPDGNNDGVPDSGEFDFDGNGVPEFWFVDHDDLMTPGDERDGKYDAINVDYNQDGKIDIRIKDEDRDGDADWLWWDRNGDGRTHNPDGSSQNERVDFQ